VTLCERQNVLGGTAYLSSLVYPPNGQLVRYLGTQVRRLPIDLRLQTEVDLPLVRELAPDVVIVAAGAGRSLPDIPGIDAAHVLGGDDLRAMLQGSDPAVTREKLGLGQRAIVALGSVTRLTRDIDRVRRLTKLWMPIGKRVVILGGGLVGVELAEFLNERGRDVIVVESGNRLAPEMAMPRRWRVLWTLRQHGVELLCDTQAESIGSDHVMVTSADGASRRLAADSVILAIGTHENHTLAKALEGEASEVHLIGDASAVGYLDGAFQTAARIARQI
jgi:pyruvate/2-oxoglutarate dehydrogenase complex dihydrolipoamide dehydrogenase (E3) component